MNPAVVMALIELGKVVVPVAIKVTPQILQALADAVERLGDDHEKRAATAHLMVVAAAMEAKTSDVA